MKKYYGIDWLRAIACIGVLGMHVAGNSNYEIKGFIYQLLIPSLSDFVYLFMAISAFGMCCGYFDKVMEGRINWIDFYKRRYVKILPFFLVLIIIDLIMSFSISSLFEAVTEITLLHGLVPHTFSVIGVSWFLGTVFAFYLVFPFYCVLIHNKKCAWSAFAVSIILCFICYYHFDTGRKNLLCSLCYFIVGGLVYLYKDKLEKVKWYMYLPGILLSLFLYYEVASNPLTRLLVTAALLAASLSVHCGEVKPISFISGISMEIYLSHMVIFRALERLHLSTMWGNGWGQYFISVMLVFMGTIVFSWSLQKIINKSLSLLKR